MPDVRIQLYNTRIDITATGVTRPWLGPLIEVLDLYAEILTIMERGPQERGPGLAARSDESTSSPLYGGGGADDDVERVLPRLVPAQGTGQEGAQ